MPGCSTQRRHSPQNAQPCSSGSPRSLSPDFPGPAEVSSLVHHQNTRVYRTVDGDEVKQLTGVKTGVEPTSTSAPSKPLRDMSFSSSIFGSFGSPNNCVTPIRPGFLIRKIHATSCLQHALTNACALQTGGSWGKHQ